MPTSQVLTAVTAAILTAAYSRAKTIKVTRTPLLDVDRVNRDLERARSFVSQQYADRLNLAWVQSHCLDGAAKRMGNEVVDWQTNFLPLPAAGLKVHLIRERGSSIGRVQIESVFSPVPFDPHYIRVARIQPKERARRP